MAVVINLDRVIEKAMDWLKDVLQKRESENEQLDANILKSAGLLVSSLRSLDNGFGQVISDLICFDSDWSAQDRQDIINKIKDFAKQQLILPKIRKYVGELEPFLTRYDDKISVYDKELIKKLVEYGRGISFAAGESSVTPFHDFGELRAFFDDIKSANTREDVQALMTKAEILRNVFDQTILADSENILGNLFTDIRIRNPTLPEPDWMMKNNQGI